MTNEEMGNLQRGDMVKHASFGSVVYVVTGNYGGRITAVRSVDLMNPQEWLKVTVSDNQS